MTESLLLDTCVVLWILEAHPRIVDDEELIIFLNQHERYISSISVAEIEIKRSIGKLKIPIEYLEKISESGIKDLPFTQLAAKRLGQLPYHHKDPFDRMLIATAESNAMTIVTTDKVFQHYTPKVRIIDA